MPKVNPKILIWARETAGLSLDRAAKQLGLGGPERLESLEKGERDPTRRQLTKMSEKYRRPLLAFYLPVPPVARDRGQDFRTLPEGRAPDAEALLDALLRDVQARQQLVRAALEEAEEAVEIPFVGSARMQDGVDALVASMKDVLQESLERFRKQKTVGDAFAVLRAEIEHRGVFVLLAGNLGTHHSNIDTDVFRGFALADKVAPFVVVNENDSRAAWSFTLLHELAHIWLGDTGVSGYDGEAEVERFCDTVAARLLLDPAELKELQMHQPKNLAELSALISAFAANRNLSRKMVAYNLLRSKMISAAMYRQLADGFDKERAEQEKNQPKGEGGPDYYVVRRHRVGPGLVRFVSRMVASGTLSSTKAGKVLGVKPTAVSRLVDKERAA